MQFNLKGILISLQLDIYDIMDGCVGQKRRKGPRGVVFSFRISVVLRCSFFVPLFFFLQAGDIVWVMYPI